MFDFNSRWGLTDKEYEKKIEILQIWKENTTELEFEKLLEVCEKLNYYSATKIGDSFVDAIESSEYKFTEDDGYIVAPLRCATRFETSNALFFYFISATGIYENDLYKTYMDPIGDLFNHILAFEKYSESQIGQLDLLTNNMETLKINCSNTSDRAQLKSIMKQIKKLEFKINDIYKNIVEEGEYNKIYLEKINCIVLMDDFIGSGKSVKKFFDAHKDMISDIKEYKPDFYFIILVLECTVQGKTVIEQYSTENNISIRIINYSVARSIFEENHIFGSSERVEESKCVLLELVQKKRIKIFSDFNMNLAVASFINAPNNNFPLLITENHRWTPLFKRKIKSDKRTDTKESRKNDIINNRKKYNT